jgi:cellobiose phosphorylase
MSSSMLIEECKPSTLREKVDWIIDAAKAIGQAPDGGEDRRMPGEVYVLDREHILAAPRDNGDSRYPYGRDGFNFWVYASGYMHCNEGLFSHFMRAAQGQEPTIAFFAGLPNGESFIPVPLLSVPQLNDRNAPPCERFTVLSSSAAYFITTTDSLRFVVRVFVTADKDICFSVQATNLSGQDRSLFLSSYFNPFLRHQVYESGEDLWFKEVRVVDQEADQGGLGSFLVRVNEDVGRTKSVSNWGIFRRSVSFDGGGRLARHESTTARMQYVGGARSSLHAAASLVNGTFGRPQSVCTFVDNAIAGDMLHLDIPAQATARLDIVFSNTSDTKRAKQLIHEPLIAEEIDKQLNELEEDDRERHHDLTLSIGQTDHRYIRPKVFNAFVEHLKRQVEFCALIKGYVQISENSLIGIRDVCQAIESLAAWRPRAAREKLIEALGFTESSGRCFRQYSLPSKNGQIGRMDLRPFIDQGSWIISAAASYLKLTGNFGILTEEVGYHRIIDEATNSVESTKEQDTVLKHLFKIMQYLLDHRDHGHTGCVRALYGDWNDAMDGLGVSMDPSQTYGTGVSVMATLHVLQNCQEMIDLLQALGDDRYARHVKAYRDAADSIRESLRKYAVVTDDKGHSRILHGWGDRRSYLVGGFDDPDGVARDGLTSNAFWVLAGMLEHSPKLDWLILDAFDRLDDKYGLKTFSPAFASNVRGVGRIGKLPPGTAENGAAYIHATAFAIMALFQMGQPKRAWDQLVKILPFTDIHENLSHSPFVMPNSYGHNPKKMIDGQNMNDWQTGSSNVVLKTLVRFVFGIEPAFGGLWIQPAGWAPFKDFKAVATVRGCDINVICETNEPRGRRFTVNGKTVEAVYDKDMQIDKLWISPQQMAENRLEIRITSTLPENTAHA